MGHLGCRIRCWHSFLILASGKANVMSNKVKSGHIFRFKIYLPISPISYSFVSRFQKMSFILTGLVYDSCQLSQLNRGKMRKCIHSITMNLYNSNLNVPINSIMLLSKCIWIDSIKEWIEWFNQINQFNIYGDLFGENLLFRWHFLKNVRFRWPFCDIFNQFNGFSHTSPWKSIDSMTYFMKTNWLIHQSAHLEKELNQFN